MAFTEEERFRFDLAGFLVRPGVLTPDEVAALVDQVDRIHHDPESLPAASRTLPGGAASMLIDHPKVVEVLHEIIGPDIRMDNVFGVWREKDQEHGLGFHRGGYKSTDPVFAYRVHDGAINAGLVRVVFELTDVTEKDGATSFLVGSHKANFQPPPEHLCMDPGKRSEFFRSYSCPAGSVIFFSEALWHCGPHWRRNTPRVAILHTYTHVCTAWHRMTIPPEVMESLPPEKQAYFREAWGLDFRTSPPTRNSVENFVRNSDSPIPWREPPCPETE